MCSSGSFKQEMSLLLVKLRNKVAHTLDMLTFDNDVFVFNLKEIVALLEQNISFLHKINEFV